MAQQVDLTEQKLAQIRFIWQVAGDLLNSAQYNQLARLLDESQLTEGRVDDGILDDLLAAAYQISLACRQCVVETERHLRASAESRQKETELNQALGFIVDVITKYALATMHDASVESQSESEALDQLRRDLTDTEERHSLWQRLQGLLGWGASTRLATQPEKAEAAETEAVPSIAEAKMLTASSVEPIEDPPKSAAEDPATSALATTEEVVESETRPPDDSELPVATPPEKAEPLSSASSEKVEELTLASTEEAEMLATPYIADDKQVGEGLPSLVVYCLGVFRVYQDDQPVEEWTSSKGKSIFKYLVTHRQRPTAKEVLMEIFWPEANPDAARNNLNVAIYGLRRSLRKVSPDLSHILFQDDCYLLNPALQIWVDVDAFHEHIRTALKMEQRGQVIQAIREYRAAEALYQDEFLAEDRYEEWLLARRQSLHADYLKVLDRLSRSYLNQGDYDACATICAKMLAVDPCREEAHRRLMRYYSQQRQRYLALRQYHLCVEALARELDVGPSQRTRELYRQVRRKGSV